MNKYFITIAILLVVGVFLCMLNGEPVAALITSVFSYMLFFVVIVDFKSERISKGLFLISFGIIYNIFYSVLFLEFFGKDVVVGDLKIATELFASIAIFSCAGAGGSLIAIHSDKSSTDRDDVLISQTVIDRTEGMLEMRRSLEILHKKLSAICIVGSLIAVVFFYSF